MKIVKEVIDNGGQASRKLAVTAAWPSSGTGSTGFRRVSGLEIVN